MASVRVLGLLCICFFGLIASDPAPANAIDDEELAGGWWLWLTGGRGLLTAVSRWLLLAVVTGGCR